MCDIVLYAICGDALPDKRAGHTFIVQCHDLYQGHAPEFSVFSVSKD